MLTMMKKIWRPAWPHRSSFWGVSNGPPMAVPTKTVNNNTLPTMPTGHGATLGRMPKGALAHSAQQRPRYPDPTADDPPPQNDARTDLDLGLQQPQEYFLEIH